MIFYNSFQSDSTINSICIHSINSKSYRKKLYKKLQSDWNYLESHYKQVAISSNILSDFLDLSIHDRYAAEILCQIVEIAEPSSFSNCIFQKIINHPDEAIRNRCIVSLSHQQLPKEFLKDLCATNLCFECYFSLILLAYTDSSISVAELNDAISSFDNSPYSDMWTELIAEIKLVTASCEEKHCLVSNHKTVDGFV